MEENDPNEAVFLFEGGEEWSLGIDLYEWKLSSKSDSLPVRGIRKVPPNMPHFLRYQITSENAKDKFGTEAASKFGFFSFLKPGQLRLFRWNDQKEEFVAVDDEDEVHRYQLGFQKHAFDKVSIGYPMDTLDVWTQLSSSITQKTVNRLRPNESNVPNFTPIVLLQGKKTADLNELRGLSAEEITRMHLDSSFAIEKLLSAPPFKDDTFEVLAEFQYAFVCFLMGESYEAFEQWKKMVILFSGAESLLTSMPSLFVEFAKVLRAQLEQVPKDFFIDPLSGKESFLKNSLKSFFELSSDSSLDPKLQMAVRDLRRFVEERFDTKFSVQGEAVYYDEYEDDEDAPVVVEM